MIKLPDWIRIRSNFFGRNFQIGKYFFILWKLNWFPETDMKVASYAFFYFFWFFCYKYAPQHKWKFLWHLAFGGLCVFQILLPASLSNLVELQECVLHILCVFKAISDVLKCSIFLRKALKKKLRDYLGIFPKRPTPPTPLLGISTIFYPIIMVKLEIFGWF